MNGNSATQRILDNLLKKIPAMEIHKHNSIPGYLDGLDEGYILCIENNLIKKVRDILKKRVRKRC